MRAIAEVERLSYEYPGTRALDAVSFTIEQGSVTALVGPNGAGKTTLLRCMAALETPLEGRIVIDGIDVLEAPRACHRRIGYLSDFYGLYGALTVRQCLTHAARAQGLPETKLAGAVMETAAELGLTGKLDALAGELSRGQRQRVAIGQALIHAPALLILDEPASGLDPEARHELARLFNGLRARGMTLLVSSHILAELDEYSTHMLVLRDGRVVESRALDQGAAAGTATVRVRVAFARKVVRSALVAAAGAQREVSMADGEGREAWITLPGADEERAALLRRLVDAGLPVIAFGQVRENLHESYLRTVREACAEGGPRIIETP